MVTIPEGILTITHIEAVARETKLFRFSINEPLSFKAGQFVSLQFGEKSWRAYSIASKPSDPYLDLLIRIVPGGIASTVLDKASIGDNFTFRGSYGHFLFNDAPKDNTVLCGTGTGIAPLRSMILDEQEKEKPRTMELWYGGRNPDDIAYLDEITNLPIRVKLAFSQVEFNDLPTYKNKNISVHTGRITQFIDTSLSHDNTDIYICGNGDMVKSVETLLKEASFDKKQIHKERFN